MQIMYNQIQLYMHGWAYSIPLIDSHSLFSIFHLPSVSPRKAISSPTSENPWPMKLEPHSKRWCPLVLSWFLDPPKYSSNLIPLILNIPLQTWFSIGCARFWDPYRSKWWHISIIFHMISICFHLGLLKLKS